MTDVEATVRRYLGDEHPDLAQGVSACADAVADRWDGDHTADRGRVVGPMRAALDRRGLRARFPAVLDEAVRAAGYEPAAPPVAAPPYVVVTSRGPVLRATVADGRLVVRFEVFAVRRADGTGQPHGVRYVRRDDDALAVEFRGR